VASALELRRVSAGYGETVVLEDVDLKLAAGECISVIGRNGVGKTTLLSTIMGHTTLHSGEVMLDGQKLNGMPSYRRALAGLGFVPQEREIFPSLTVRENLDIGARPGHWTLPRVFELFPRLQERLGNMGNQLSGGEQQMLSIARALLTNPRILLMDEPTEGLAPVLVDTLIDVLAKLRAESALSIILVEQNSRVAFAFSPRTVILDKGRIVYDGYSEPLRADPERLAKLIGFVASPILPPPELGVGWVGVRGGNACASFTAANPHLRASLASSPFQGEEGLRVRLALRIDDFLKLAEHVHAGQQLGEAGVRLALFPDRGDELAVFELDAVHRDVDLGDVDLVVLAVA
jgi:branched-chain amino acid transport system ATP-binding protein